MSLSTSLDKLRFIIEEMEIGLFLARHAPDDFIARCLARHVIIRTENLIEHLRRLRRPLRQAGYQDRQFNQHKEALANEFGVHQGTARHKFSAHVQDLELAHAIAVWNNIEVITLNNFVQMAKRIYEHDLYEMDIPGYMIYTTPGVVSSEAVKVALEKYTAEVNARPHGEFCSDWLSLTRPNTTSILGGHPIHTRASQLSVIRRWVKEQRQLLKFLGGHLLIRRILKARIVTDVVSFSDCLITRPIAVDAPQRLGGLDQLLQREEGLDANVINDYLAASNHGPLLEQLRDLRNRIGAHVSNNSSEPLHDILRSLEELGGEQTFNFYELLLNVFTKTCKNQCSPLLMPYVGDGYSPPGTEFRPAAPHTPFDEAVQRRPSQIAVDRADVNSIAEYHKYFKMWSTGDDYAREIARRFFTEASLHSKVVKQLRETESLGGSARYHRKSFREAHVYLQDRLQGADLAAVKQALLLIEAIKRGDPYPLAEVLVNYADSQALLHNKTVAARYLGLVAGWPHTRTFEFLRSLADVNYPSTRVIAIIALFQIYVRSEGLANLNYRTQVTPFADVIEPLVESLEQPHKLLCTLALASQFCVEEQAVFEKAYSGVNELLQNNVLSQVQRLCGLSLQDVGYGNLKHLVATRDYPGVCLLVCTELMLPDSDRSSEILLGGVRDHLIVPAGHSGSIRHAICCLFALKFYQLAAIAAHRLAKEHPDDLDLQMFYVMTLAHVSGARGQVEREVARIRQQYVLDPESKRSLTEICTLIAI
ncbi:hypothetical protein [Marinimicrobium sp. ABcell2]|uniref:hypothetical protein n=1 Tax=Marinimicrobium sp. ABcell2 TaxID=3069751 RepID=UPI0027AE16F9|nr:hypothetical protein [Marinimicrobium sp. ABcell2]MDQ2077492.1 hypothetical protein [Marinimicrobium sp. ABcell2]